MSTAVGFAGMVGFVLGVVALALFAALKSPRSAEPRSKDLGPSASTTSGQSPSELNYVPTSDLLTEVMRRYDATAFVSMRANENKKGDASFEAIWSGNHVTCAGLCTYGQNKIWQYFAEKSREEKS